jgi:hypothetical protein
MFDNSHEISDVGGSCSGRHPNATATFMSPADRICLVPGRFRHGGMLGRLALGASAAAVAILVWGSDSTPEKSNMAQIQPEQSSNRHPRIAPAQPTGAAPKSRSSAMIVLDPNSKEVASLNARAVTRLGRRCRRRAIAAPTRSQNPQRVCGAGARRDLRPQCARAGRHLRGYVRRYRGALSPS